MKRAMIPMLIALGFACIGQASAAVETYTVPMNGYVVVAFVGTTPAEVAQAQPLTKNWEAQRHLMLKPQSMKAVAIRQSPTFALTQTELRSCLCRLGANALKLRQPTAAMTRITIPHALGGKVVDWLDNLTGEESHAGPPM